MKEVFRCAAGLIVSPYSGNDPASDKRDDGADHRGDGAVKHGSGDSPVNHPIRDTGRAHDNVSDKARQTPGYRRGHDERPDAAVPIAPRRSSEKQVARGDQQPRRRTHYSAHDNAIVLVSSDIHQATDGSLVARSDNADANPYRRGQQQRPEQAKTRRSDASS